MNVRAVRHALEVITNLALIAVCIAILFSLMGGGSASFHRNSMSAWRSGESFPEIQGLRHLRGKDTDSGESFHCYNS
jgi:hypothetical protein